MAPRWRHRSRPQKKKTSLNGAVIFFGQCQCILTSPECSDCVVFYGQRTNMGYIWIHHTFMMWVNMFMTWICLGCIGHMSGWEITKIFQKATWLIGRGHFFLEHDIIDIPYLYIFIWTLDIWCIHIYPLLVWWYSQEKRSLCLAIGTTKHCITLRHFWHSFLLSI